MALTQTPDPEIGKPCPDFELPFVDYKKNYSLKDFEKYKALLVMFICNHCPYVKAIEDRLLSLAADVQEEGCGIVAVCSNETSKYKEDEPAALFARWKEKKYPFPYLHDAKQEIARKFGAVCTPDFFLYDKNRKLVYRGRLDDNWKEAAKVHRQELREAIEAVLYNNEVPKKQNPSMGCSIKWL